MARGPLGLSGWLLAAGLLATSPVAAQTSSAPAPATSAPAASGPAPSTAPAATAPSTTVPAPGTVPTGPPPTPSPTVPARTFPTFSIFSPAAVRPPAVFELHPTFSLSEEYSDNWFLTATDKESNWRTTASAGLTLTVNGARTQGSLSLGYGVSYDTVDDQFSGDLAISLAGQFVWQATPVLTITVTDTLTRSDDPFDADALGLRRERNPYLANLFSVAADYRLTTWTLNASYLFSAFLEEEGANTYSHTISVGATKSFLERNYVTATYSFLYSETTDGGGYVTGHQFGLTFGHQVNAQTTVGLLGSYAYRDGTDTVADDYNVATIGAFGSYVVPGIWSAYLALGYSGFDPTSGATDGAPYASGTFTYQFARGTFTLTADSGFSETYVTGENLGIVQTWGVAGTFAYPFTPFLSGTATGFYRNNQNVAGGDVSDEGSTYGANLGLSVPLRSWLNLSLYYGYRKFNADVPTDDYTENRAQLTLSAGF